jgi:hypothetical protein
MAGLESFENLANTANQMPIVNPVTLEEMEEGGQSMYLLLLGQDSEKWRALERRQKTQGYNRFRKNQNAPLTAEQTDAEALARLVVCTVGWSLYVDGAWADFSEDAAKAIYLRFPWLMDQAKQFMEDRQNFLPTAKPRSVSMPGGSFGNTSPEEKTSPAPSKSGKVMNGSMTDSPRLA